MNELRPRLRRSVDPRITEDGRAFLLRGPRHDDLEIGGDAELLARLFELMDGSRTLAELAGELGADATELGSGVAALVDAGVVDDASDEVPLLAPSTRRRYERQLSYFADMCGGAREAALAQQRLAGARVCVLGLGGLGSWVAFALASSGVGEIVGVDCDRVELSNLNRQILFGEEQLGDWKAEAAGLTLGRFNSGMSYQGVRARLDSLSAVEQAIAGSDAVAAGVDWPAHRIGGWVNAACFRAGIPYVAMTQHPPKIRVGPFYRPGEPGCLACQETSYRASHELYGLLERACQPVPPSATFGPACGVVGTLVANELVAHLSGIHPPASRGNALILDLATFEVEREPVAPVEGCGVCSAG